MKGILICRDSVDARNLGLKTSPALASFFGRPLLCHWIDHLVAIGATELTIIAVEAPDQIRQHVGAGEAWGVRIDVDPARTIPSTEDLNARLAGAAKLLPCPYQVVDVCGLPNSGIENIFESAESYFTAARCWLAHAHKNRVAMKELSPGIWVSTRSHVSTKATLIAPCWISDYATISDNAVVGPMAFVEPHVIVGKGAVLSNSIAQANTYIGDETDVQNSIASGSCLTNWKTNSKVQVPDPFILGDVREQFQPLNLTGRLAALLTLAATTVLVSPMLAYSTVLGQRTLTTREFVRPNGTIGVYREYVFGSGFFRRWPQLWNVVTGDFTWFGNRPLSRQQAASLRTDLDKLWLAASPGLFSQGDAFACWDIATDEARAHAAFYSVRRDRGLNLRILHGVVQHWTKARREIVVPMSADSKPSRLMGFRQALSDFLSL
jgi:NDP-sugar pyrophosphorylase family protein